MRSNLEYNVINDPKNPLEISSKIAIVFQNFIEKLLTNNYDNFEAKLRDYLRYFDKNDLKMRKVFLKQIIENDNNRAAQIESLNATFHSTKSFYLDLNYGD